MLKYYDYDYIYDNYGKVIHDYIDFSKMCCRLGFTPGIQYNFSCEINDIDIDDDYMTNLIITDIERNYECNGHQDNINNYIYHGLVFRIRENTKISINYDLLEEHFEENSYKYFMLSNGVDFYDFLRNNKSFFC